MRLVFFYNINKSIACSNNSMSAAPQLSTETPHALHAQLDQYPTVELTAAFIDDQLGAVAAVRAASATLAAAVDAALPRIEAGGRLVYVGAGTSGRLGLLDSVELYPTFSWPTARAVALMAGGEEAIYRAIEGAEDSRDHGASHIAAIGVSVNDVVLVLAASGSTPYALGALAAARAAGALTIGIANNPDAPITREAEFGVTLDTGPEVISGSTRLKAGTAQKIALNTFSSSLMVRLNKVYGNLMVDVKPTNIKLIARTVRLTVAATACSEEAARAALANCQHEVKTAIVMVRKNLGADAARALLLAHRGSVRAALEAI